MVKVVPSHPYNNNKRIEQPTATAQALLLHCMAALQPHSLASIAVTRATPHVAAGGTQSDVIWLKAVVGGLVTCNLECGLETSMILASVLAEHPR